MEKYGICYIFGAAKISETDISPKEGDCVIAADGGFAELQRLSISADIVVGDFDSLKRIPEHENVLKYPVEKDDTDMMLAVKEGIYRGYKKFILYGGLGGRLDHTLANIQVLVNLSRNRASGYLVGDGMVITAVSNGSITFLGDKKGTISVFCSGDKAEGVCLEGLKYPLVNADLSDDVPLGISNEFTGRESKITVGKGTLVILWNEDNFTL